MKRILTVGHKNDPYDSLIQITFEGNEQLVKLLSDKVKWYLDEAGNVSCQDIALEELK